MKQRMISLVAVMLCMLVVWMPVAQAVVYVYNPYLPIGDLIKGGSVVTAMLSCSAEITYVNSEDEIIDTSGTFWSPFSEMMGRHTILEGWWHIVDSTDYGYGRRLEQVVPLTFSENEEEEQLGIFSTIFTQNPGTANPVSAAEVEKDFEEWLQGNEPEAQMACYEMHWFESYESYGTKNPNYPNSSWATHPTDEGFWSGQIDPQTETDVKLPNPDGKILALLRWKDGEVVSVPFTKSSDGVMPTSANDWYNGPVAIVYDEPEEPAPAPAEGALPQTGDQSPLTLWFTLAAAALAGMTLIFRRRKHA